MPVTITWLGHASFRIECDTVTYIDPWKLVTAANDADLILISHSHYDHYSEEDIHKIAKGNTQLIAPHDVIDKRQSGTTIQPMQSVDLANIHITAIASYNPDKEFHPKENLWLGFVIRLDGKTLYYAGDTDLVQEMSLLRNIDLALLPIGGTYTMNPREAAEAVERIKPAMAVPYHWGDIIGSKEDAETFQQLASCNTQIIMPGETLQLD